MNYQDFVEIIKPYLADDRSDFPFFNSRIYCDWVARKAIPIASCEPGTYESELCNHLTARIKNTGTIESNLKVIVGGIGSGKTTVINRTLDIAIATRPVCACQTNDDKCSAITRMIKFDFRGWQDGVVLKSDRERIESFWNTIETIVSSSLYAPPKIENEILEFWPWLLVKVSLLQKSEKINIFLKQISPMLSAACLRQEFMGKSPVQVINELHAKRDNLYSNLPIEDFAWYRTFYLLHESEKNENKCNQTLLVFDNVDGLDPGLQRICLEIAKMMCGFLNAKTIVAMRPLTLKNTDYENCVDSINHCSASFESVVRARLEVCITQNKEILGETGISAIKALIQAIDPVYGKLSKLVKPTSGLSIRYALRNIFNMLESPIVSSNFGKPKFIKSMNLTEISRAYFLGARGTMIDHAFENIYVVGNFYNDQFILVKPRILDFIKRCHGGCAIISDVCNFICSFGHEPETVTSALKELAMRARPLLWSEDGYGEVNAKSNARIMITPIGVGYLDELFGQLFYDEVCLIAESSAQITPSHAIQLHQKITEIDISESKEYIRKTSTYKYQMIYPEHNSSALCLAHWRNLHNGLRAIQNTYLDDIIYDEEREIWIRDQIKSKLIA